MQKNIIERVSDREYGCDSKRERDRKSCVCACECMGVHVRAKERKGAREGDSERVREQESERARESERKKTMRALLVPCHNFLLENPLVSEIS